MVVNDYNDYNHWLVTRGTQALPLDAALMPLLYLTNLRGHLPHLWSFKMWKSHSQNIWKISKGIDSGGTGITKYLKFLKFPIFFSDLSVPPLSIMIRHSELSWLCQILPDPLCHKARPDPWRTYTHLTRVSATAFRGTNIVPSSTRILLDVHGNPIKTWGSQRSKIVFIIKPYNKTIKPSVNPYKTL